MGRYINKGNYSFACSRADEYVDKTGLIKYLNSTIDSQKRFTCISRARRFGKSMALNMLYAYYDKSCDSHALFDDLEIAKDASYEKYINKFNVIHIDVTSFITEAQNKDVLDYMIERVIKDIRKAFPNVDFEEEDSLMSILEEIVIETGERFIFLIDEWDALCREYRNQPAKMDRYVNLLRSLFKGGNTDRVFAAVYMTGILPIKHYGVQSALNNFRTYSMVLPEPVESYFGFTQNEVQALCDKHQMDYHQMEQWYNGYRLGTEPKIFNPTSVMTAIDTRMFRNYWPRTESFESIKALINMNFDGVKESLEEMLVGKSVPVAVGSFGNDANEISNRDELFTLLIHYGYLAYDADHKEAYIPNQEIREELLLAVKLGNRPELTKLILDSDALLQATINGETEFVANALNHLHSTKVAPIHYNNEEALRSLIHLAYISAIDSYIEIQELPTGNGYADVVFIPHRNNGKPALVIELKYDKTAKGAIDQIKERRYPEVLKKFTDQILLVGINYDKESKEHTCIIEVNQQ